MVFSMLVFSLVNVLFFSFTRAIPYDQYILAPSSRTLHPISVYKVNGTVTGAESVTEGNSGSVVFQDDSAVTYDYAKNIAGIVSINISSVSDVNQYIGLTFSESSLWISGLYSDATADAGRDEALWFHVTGPGVYTVDAEHERGGFKYLSLVHNSTGSVEITDVTTHFTPVPHYAEDQMRNYTGYFHCNDELINRIWYAGAYTNQLCTIAPNRGNALVHLGEINSTETITTPNTWYNNYTITNGTSSLVDGAKRDRLVWAGDMSIAVPAIVVSTNDLISVQNSLDSLFAIQNATTGQLPYAGKPFFTVLSFTYHLYTLIGVSDLYTYSNDIDYLSAKWDQYKLALNFSLSFIDESGLANVTSPNDWLRFGMGGHNIEANSILYYTINQAITLASALNDTSLIPTWQSTALTIKSTANTLLWNDTTGLYHDNETTLLSPQDGNVWAIISNLTDSPSKITSISAALAERWTPYGAPAPEASSAISPFISGFELQAHLLAANATRALNLMRLEWGFMLDDPRMTNSTFIEGYADNGNLHYAPYTNDARVSFAHGWATGPTSTLTFLVAGVQLTSAGGKTWRIEPALGDLTKVEAGFSTSLGWFESKTIVREDGKGVNMSFETPEETMGVVAGSFLGCNGKAILSGKQERSVDVGEGRVEIKDVKGGKYTLSFSCS